MGVGRWRERSEEARTAIQGIFMQKKQAVTPYFPGPDEIPRGVAWTEER